MGLAPGIALKFYNSVTKGLKIKIWAGSYVWKSCRGKAGSVCVRGGGGEGGGGVMIKKSDVNSTWDSRNSCNERLTYVLCYWHQAICCAVYSSYYKYLQKH